MSFRKESVDRRYEICLNIVNANAKFFIPVLILSPNPIINFPKEISLPDTAVNTPAYSNIFVLNYSSHFQKFSFECRSEISIIPDCKTIGVKASDGSTFLIEFVSKSVGNFREKIHICFDNGKKASIVVRCHVIPINIFLSELIEKLRNDQATKSFNFQMKKTSSSRQLSLECQIQRQSTLSTTAMKLLTSNGFHWKSFTTTRKRQTDLMHHQNIFSFFQW